MKKLLICVALLSTTAFATVDEKKEAKLGELAEYLASEDFKRRWAEIEEDMEALKMLQFEYKIRRECLDAFYGEDNERNN